MTVPGAAAARIPSSRNISLTFEPTGTIVTTKSTSLEASLTDFVATAPACTAKLMASSERSYTLSEWPALIRLRTIGPPIFPKPIKPTFAITFS